MKLKDFLVITLLLTAMFLSFWVTTYHLNKPDDVVFILQFTVVEVIILIICKHYIDRYTTDLKIRLQLLGLSHVNPKKYDFHITPVITYSRVLHPECEGAWLLSIEWGHWALGGMIYNLKRTKIDITASLVTYTFMNTIHPGIKITIDAYSEKEAVMNLDAVAKYPGMFELQK